MERMGPEDDVYRQIQYYPVWIYLMLAALLVMFIVVAIVVDVAGSAAATVGMIFGVVVVVGALIFFWRLTFIITPTRVGSARCCWLQANLCIHNADVPPHGKRTTAPDPMVRFA